MRKYVLLADMGKSEIFISYMKDKEIEKARKNSQGIAVICCRRTVEQALSEARKRDGVDDWTFNDNRFE